MVINIRQLHTRTTTCYLTLSGLRRTPPRAEKMAHLPRFEGFRDRVACAPMAADRVVWRGLTCALDTLMLALREELPMEDDIARLEPRVARIEADVSQLNARVANVEVDLRDFRKSMDHRLEVMDGKFDHRLEVLTATMAEGFRAIDARFEKMDARMDARFEKMDARFESMDGKLAEGLKVMDGKLTEGLKAIDGKLDRMDTKFEGKLDKLDAKFEGRFDALGKRRFALLIALLSATATLVAAVLGVLLSGPHGH